LEFSSYERFMQDRGILGIGNMVSYSLESSCRMIGIHATHFVRGQLDLDPFKHKMYTTVEPSIEPRLKSYGWENSKRTNVSMDEVKIELLKKLKPTTHSIKWGNVISTLLDTPLHESSTFR